MLTICRWKTRDFLSQQNLLDQVSPFVTFFRDLKMFDRGTGEIPKVTKSAAAISHWLRYDITDVPVEITRLSLQSYTQPVSEDGTLPMKLFGQPLNFKRITEKGIQWLICIAEGDDLVDQDAALAPLALVDAEVTVFPKGHASMATFWSAPASGCSLETKDADECAIKRKYRPNSIEGKSRGPVRFHLDLEEN